MKSRVVLFLVFLALLAAGPDSSKEKTSKGRAVLRVETRLIEVNVVAQDSKGRAVTDLTRDDFKLYDNGKEVPIDIFSAASLKATTPAAPLPPNTFSNRVAGAPSVTVILLDGLNTSFEDQTWARTEVVRFLEEMPPQDRAAIFLLGDHLYVLQNFTSDPQLLLQALKGAKARSSREFEASSLPPQQAGARDQSSSDQNTGSGATQASGIAPSAPPVSSGGGGRSGPNVSGVSGAAAAAAQAAVAQSMQQFEQHETAFFGIDRVQRTMDALIAIANYLAQFPGRKNLIWVSASFPISIGFDTARSPGDTRDQIHFSPELKRAYKALSNADLAVYPVDARGLVAGTSNAFFSTLATLDEIASHTGGRAFYNTNDLARVMKAAVEDSAADYTLGFYPHGTRWDGKYHTLRIAVMRRGVRLRYRQGYFASLATPKNADQANAQFSQALLNPLDATGVGLNVTLRKVIHRTYDRQVLGANRTVQFHDDRALLGIDVDAHNITLQGETGSRTVQLTVLVAQKGADGKVLNSASYDLQMRVAANGVGRFLGEGLRIDKWVKLVRGVNTLELVVRDAASGDLGSVRIPLTGA